MATLLRCDGQSQNLIEWCTPLIKWIDQIIGLGLWCDLTSWFLGGPGSSLLFNHASICSPLATLHLLTSFLARGLSRLFCGWPAGLDIALADDVLFPLALGVSPAVGVPASLPPAPV